MKGHVETLCFPSLKGVRKAGQELLDRGRAKAVADPSSGLLRKALGHVRFRIGPWNDIDWLDLVLEWRHDVGGEGFAISQEWRDNVFACRTDRETVRRFVIGAE